MSHVVMALAIAVCITATLTWAEDFPLWEVYQDHFVNAKYVDLTHAFRPDQPVWSGFAKAKFMPARSGCVRIHYLQTFVRYPNPAQ